MTNKIPEDRRIGKPPTLCPTRPQGRIYEWNLPSPHGWTPGWRPFGGERRWGAPFQCLNHEENPASSIIEEKGEGMGETYQIPRPVIRYLGSTEAAGPDFPIIRLVWLCTLFCAWSLFSSVLQPVPFETHHRQKTRSTVSWRNICIYFFQKDPKKQACHSMRIRHRRRFEKSVSKQTWNHA